MLVLIFVFIAVALPIIVIWTSHAIITWQDEKQSTSFSAIYPDMQREIKLKEIHRQASAVANKRNRQALSGQYLKPVNVDKKDPVWLSAYTL